MMSYYQTNLCKFMVGAETEVAEICEISAGFITNVKFVIIKAIK